ncbi:hypothetical protein THAOC_12958, partial [Thalassiosira oceanica]
EPAGPVDQQLYSKSLRQGQNQHDHVSEGKVAINIRQREQGKYDQYPGHVLEQAARQLRGRPPVGQEVEKPLS